MWVIELLLEVLIVFLYGTLVGWISHWALHQQWSGPFHKAHLTHHTKNYPPKRVTSHHYLSSGKNDGLFFFVPLSLVAVVVFLLGLALIGAPFWTYVVFLIEGAVIGLLNELLHMGFHINDHWLNRLGFFRQLCTNHYRHHWNVKSHLGIIWFGWDRLFGRFLP